MGKGKTRKGIVKIEVDTGAFRYDAYVSSKDSRFCYVGCPLCIADFESKEAKADPSGETIRCILGTDAAFAERSVIDVSELVRSKGNLLVDSGVATLRRRTRLCLRAERRAAEATKKRSKV